MVQKYYLYDKKVELIFDDVRHKYEANGESVYGTTSIIGVLDKPALKFWAVNMAMEVLEKELIPGVSLDEVQIKSLIDEARRAHMRRLSKAADIGTMIHGWLESYVKAVLEKKALPKKPINKEMNNAINSFLQWIKDSKVKFLKSEQKIYSRKYHYAGTFDLEAIVDGKRTIIDFKTSKAIYPEMLLQTSAYLKAKEEETDMEYDGGVIILRLSKEDKDKRIESFEVVKDTNIENHFKCFLACLDIYTWKMAIKREEAQKRNMTKNAQTFLDKEIAEGNIEPTKLQLAERLPGGGVKGTGPHTLKVLRDEIGKNKDYMTSDMVSGIWFYLEEDGREYKYFVPFKNKENRPHYLMERLAPIDEGTTIVMEYINQGGKGYIDVKTADEVKTQNTINRNSEPEIPVIESEDTIDYGDPSMQ
ncbi:MAG: hypothetical protein ISS01_03210 [Nanoarchaeota archaeon]|nr:hypothetical protein [Nanoarchaeota archaeon]